MYFEFIHHLLSSSSSQGSPYSLPPPARVASKKKKKKKKTNHRVRAASALVQSRCGRAIWRQQQQQQSSASKSFLLCTRKHKAGAAVMDDTGEVTSPATTGWTQEHLGMGSERFAFKMEAVTPSGEASTTKRTNPATSSENCPVQITVECDESSGRR